MSSSDWLLCRQIVEKNRFDARQTPLARLKNLTKRWIVGQFSLRFDSRLRRTEPKPELWELPSHRLSGGEFTETGMRHLDAIQHQTLEKYSFICEDIWPETRVGSRREGKASQPRDKDTFPPLLPLKNPTETERSSAAKPQRRKTHEPPIRRQQTFPPCADKQKNARNKL